MNYINLTKMVIPLEGSTIPPSGRVAEYDPEYIFQGTINGLEKYIDVGGTVIGLPPAEEGVTYIVTSAVKDATDRSDVISIASIWGLS